MRTAATAPDPASSVASPRRAPCVGLVSSSTRNQDQFLPYQALHQGRGQPRPAMIRPAGQSSQFDSMSPKLSSQIRLLHGCCYFPCRVARASIPKRMSCILILCVRIMQAGGQRRAVERCALHVPPNYLCTLGLAKNIKLSTNDTFCTHVLLHAEYVQSTHSAADGYGGERQLSIRDTGPRRPGARPGPPRHRSHLPREARATAHGHMRGDDPHRTTPRGAGHAGRSLTARTAPDRHSRAPRADSCSSSPRHGAASATRLRFLRPIHRRANFAQRPIPWL